MALAGLQPTSEWFFWFLLSAKEFMGEECDLTFMKANLGRGKLMGSSRCCK